MKRLWVFAAIVLAGCSSFNREWKRAAGQPRPASGLAGRWEGRWISDKNGHNGKLRCLITPMSELYNARFHAKYKRILSFDYTVPLSAERSNDLFRFVGEADLGKLAGGLYTYAGAARGTNFHSKYKSKYDHGRFEMYRVP